MKFQSYNDFWQRIHSSAREKAFPLRVMFELTYRCNFKCRHCYLPQSYRRRGELRAGEIFPILDRLAEAGCFYLGFTGGEPFIRKDILQILRYARRKGFELIIYTNGSLIDEKIADELARIRPNKVDITIPATSKDAFERISGLKGSRARVFRAIELLSERKIALGFKTCVLKENESEIKQIQDFAASLGAPHRLDDMLSRRLDGSGEPFRYRGNLRGSSKKDTESCNSSGSRFSPACRTGRVLGSRPNTPSTSLRAGEHPFDFAQGRRTPITDNLFRCGVGNSQAAITPLGELKPCLMIDYPRFKILNRFSVLGSRFSAEHPFDFAQSRRTPLRLRSGQANTDNRKLKTDLKTAWEKLKEFVSSIKPDKNYKCDKCGLEAYCKWCPARGWLYNGSFTACDPQSRPRIIHHNKLTSGRKKLKSIKL